MYLNDSALYSIFITNWDKWILLYSMPVHVSYHSSDSCCRKWQNESQSTPWTYQHENWRHRSFRMNVLKLDSYNPVFTSIWTHFCCRWSPMRLCFRRWIKWLSFMSYQLIKLEPMLTLVRKTRNHDGTG